MKKNQIYATIHKSNKVSNTMSVYVTAVEPDTTTSLVNTTKRLYELKLLHAKAGIKEPCNVMISPKTYHDIIANERNFHKMLYAIYRPITELGREFDTVGCRNKDYFKEFLLGFNFIICNEMPDDTLAPLYPINQ